MVAKSFQKFEMIGEVYTKNNRQYIKVRNPSTGTVREVRWYSASEYAKMYPEDTVKEEAANIVVPPIPAQILNFDAKKALGFGEAGYITIFKGNTQQYDDWFNVSPARYHCTWGWYLPSNEHVPSALPVGIEPVRLEWTEVSTNDSLNPQTAIKTVVEAKLYEPSKSEYVGKIGERIEVELTVTNAVTIDKGNYGPSTFYVMTDANENVYTWQTAAKNCEKGTTHKIKGTIKDHKLYKNEKQTVLTRCTERN